MEKAREFWIDRISKAISMMTNDELARMAHNYTGFPGAIFVLEMRHDETTHESVSHAYVLAEATPESFSRHLVERGYTTPKTQQ